MKLYEWNVATWMAKKPLREIATGEIALILEDGTRYTVSVDEVNEGLIITKTEVNGQGAISIQPKHQNSILIK